MVVLPAPLGPSSEKIVPSATVRSMPSSTTLSPNDFRSPVAEIASRVGIIVIPLLSKSSFQGLRRVPRILACCASAGGRLAALSSLPTAPLLAPPPPCDPSLRTAARDGQDTRDTPRCVRSVSGRLVRDAAGPEPLLAKSSGRNFAVQYRDHSRVPGYSHRCAITMRSQQ